MPDDTLSEAYLRLEDTGPEWGEDHLTNHGPMAVEVMVRRGYAPDFAERCYKQIECFGSYGFPESHALSFGRLVYVSSWLKCFYPAVFGCAGLVMPVTPGCR